MSATRSTPATAPTVCTTGQRVTRSLLGYGVIVGPMYVGVSLAEAFSREGFDLSRHSWSLLANGHLGWIHVVALVLTGVLTIAFGIGLGRSLAGANGGRWAARLMTTYGACLVAAGAFRADPAMGFPAGTPQGPGGTSWHGVLHLVAGGVGFTCVAGACFLLARRYSAHGRERWASFSRLTGITFVGGFTMVASGRFGSTANLVFTAAVVVVWGWIAAVAIDNYRSVGDGAGTPTIAGATPR